jgi:hypothetical protein
MMGKDIVTFVTASASQLPSLKRRLSRAILHVVLIGMVAMLSIFIGTALSAMFLSGVE